MSCIDVLGDNADQTIASHASSLVSLHLRASKDAPMGDEEWAAFAQCANLQDLHLACDVDFPRQEPAQPLKALTSLALPAVVEAHGVWMADLGAALASMTHLRAFSLMYDASSIQPDRATDDQAVALRDALQPLTGLARLHVGPYLAFWRHQALTLLAGLSTLCELRAVSMTAIFELPSMPAELAQPWAAVSALVFDFMEAASNSFSYGTAAVLRSWTAALPLLTHLSVSSELSCDRVSDAPVLSTLTFLRLFAQREDDEKALSYRSLHAMLAPATALVSLDLQQLDILPTESLLLFALLSACTQLTRLRLRAARVTADAQWVDGVTQHVPAFPHLRHFSLRNCVLHQPSRSVSSRRVLREALLGLTELQELEIAVSAANLSPFVCALACGMQRLCHLRLWLCELKKTRWMPTASDPCSDALTEPAVTDGSSVCDVCQQSGVRLLLNDDD